MHLVGSEATETRGWRCLQNSPFEAYIRFIQPQSLYFKIITIQVVIVHDVSWYSLCWIIDNILIILGSLSVSAVSHGED